MPNVILAFDTSAAHCAAALISDGRLRAETCEPMARGQAERLLPLLEELLRDRGLDWSGIGALAVGTGPGNFTGIRISVAAARGLALARGIPAIGVSGFEALTVAVEPACLAALPAPRDAVYLQPMAAGRATAPAILAPLDDALPDAVPALPVIGHEAAQIARRIGSHALAPPAAGPPARIAEVAARRLAAGAPASRPAPLYVRPADAAPSRDAPPPILP